MSCVTSQQPATGLGGAGGSNGRAAIMNGATNSEISRDGLGVIIACDAARTLWGSGRSPVDGRYSYLREACCTTVREMVGEIHGAWSEVGRKWIPGMRARYLKTRDEYVLCSGT